MPELNDYDSLEQWLEARTSNLRSFQQCRRAVVHCFELEDEHGIWQCEVFECGHWARVDVGWVRFTGEREPGSERTCRQCAMLHVLCARPGLEALKHYDPLRCFKKPPGFRRYTANEGIRDRTSYFKRRH